MAGRRVPDRGEISICICTFRRPEGLQRVLQSLARLSLPLDNQVEVIVVDNDSHASARITVESFAGAFPLTLRYFCETRSGVSHARNRCVSEARGEWIAFIDDDEYCEPDWLTELWKLSQSAAADGVFGPVLADFAAPPPQWLIDSGAHQRPRLPTGTSMSYGDCRTGNVLFRRIFWEVEGGFDAKLAASGGEDSDFFWRCVRRGARFVWCDSAIVHESVPEVRMQRAWLLERAYRGGRTYTYLRGRHIGPMVYLSDAGWGALSVVIYAPLALGARLLRRTTSLKYERKVAGGVGKLLGWLPPPGADYARGHT